MNAKNFESKSRNTFERQWAKEFNSLLHRILCRQGQLKKQLKEFDDKRQECLHFLELEHPNAAKRAKVVAYLTQISQNRRIVKEELHDIDSVLNKINGKKPIDEEVERSYNYSEDFLIAILGNGDE